MFWGGGCVRAGVVEVVLISIWEWSIVGVVVIWASLLDQDLGFSAIN